jgi:transcriptional regulator GlxA family with amidase domain
VQVAIIVFDGVDELDAVGPYRVFAGAAGAGADVSVSLVTVEAADRVTTSNGLTIRTDGTLDAFEPDLVIVPGGGWSSRADESAWTEARRGVIPVPDAVAALHGDGVTVAGVCTGGMLLAEAGLTDGRPAVTHAGAIDDLRETGAEVVDARVVDDGDLLTAGGVTAGLDLALQVVEREFGVEIADAVATNIEYERRGEVVRS